MAIKLFWRGAGVALLSLGLILAQPPAMAQESDSDKENTTAGDTGFEPAHKVVIQVSSPDPQIHQIALNNAVNLQRGLGMDNVKIEVVAYGPGLGLFTGQSPASNRVPSLAMQNISFSACSNTINKLTAKQGGRPPVLVQGVKVVPGGVERIVKLQEQGYAYIRP